MTSLLRQIAPNLGCGGFYILLLICLTIAEKSSKPSFKRDLTRAIQTSEIFTVGARLPTFFISIFDAVFTDKLFSFRGFFRSFLASIVVVSILLSFWYSSIPEDWHLRLTDLQRDGFPEASRTWFLIAVHQLTDVPFNLDIDRYGNLSVVPDPTYHGPRDSVAASLSMHRADTFLLLPFIYNVFADYLALMVTRRTLEHLAHRPTLTIDRLILTFLITTCIILAISLAVLYIDFPLMDYLLRFLSSSTASTPPSGRVMTSFVSALLFPFYKRFPLILGEWSIATLYGAFVWSTLMGILWLIGFLILVVVAKLSMRLRGVGPWLNSNFVVQSHPFLILKVLAIIPVSAVCLIYSMLR